MICTEKQASFADRLKAALALRNVTKADLSRMTGIFKSSLTHYERGDWEGKQDAVYKIARALNVSEAWLMGYGSYEDIYQTSGIPPEQEKQPAPESELSEWDRAMLSACHDLSEEDRQLVLRTAQALRAANAGPPSADGK